MLLTFWIKSGALRYVRQVLCHWALHYFNGFLWSLEVLAPFYDKGTIWNILNPRQRLELTLAKQPWLSSAKPQPYMQIYQEEKWKLFQATETSVAICYVVLL